MTEESTNPAPGFGESDVAKSYLIDISFVNTECFEQRTIPCNYDPRNIAGRINKGYKMIIKKGTNRITLYRFLFAKLVYASEGLSLEEYLLFHHLYYDLTDLVEKDPLFCAKYKFQFEKMESIMKQLGGVRVFPVILEESCKEKIKRIFIEELPTQRAYLGLAGQRDLRSCFRLVLNDTIVPKKVPPKRFIGVGYKDKGSRRDPAYDGSPSWQEVATTYANRERELEELDSSFSDPTGFEE